MVIHFMFCWGLCCLILLTDFQTQLSPFRVNILHSDHPYINFSTMLSGALLSASMLSAVMLGATMLSAMCRYAQCRGTYTHIRPNKG